MNNAEIKKATGDRGEVPARDNLCGPGRFIRPDAVTSSGSCVYRMREPGALRGRLMGYGDRLRGGRNKTISSLPKYKPARSLRAQNGPKTLVRLIPCPDISMSLMPTQELVLAFCSHDGGKPTAKVVGMDVQEMRRVHLQRLIDKFAGGEQKAFAKRTGCSVGYISQVINGFRNLGPSVARRIEAALEQPRGSMDRDPTEMPQEALELAKEWMGLPPDVRQEVRAYIRVRRLIGNQPGGSYEEWEDRIKTNMEQIKSKLANGKS